jgi:hypothetical protein
MFYILICRGLEYELELWEVELKSKCVKTYSRKKAGDNLYVPMADEEDLVLRLSTEEEEEEQEPQCILSYEQLKAMEEDPDFEFWTITVPNDVNLESFQSDTLAFHNNEKFKPEVTKKKSRAAILSTTKDGEPKLLNLQFRGNIRYIEQVKEEPLSDFTLKVDVPKFLDLKPPKSQLRNATSNNESSKTSSKKKKQQESEDVI